MKLFRLVPLRFLGDHGVRYSRTGTAPYTSKERSVSWFPNGEKPRRNLGATGDPDCHIRTVPCVVVVQVTAFWEAGGAERTAGMLSQNCSLVIQADALYDG